MKNLAIARRYAMALLLIGKDDGKAESYREELERIRRVITGDKELELIVSNPLYESQQRKKVLEVIAERLELSSIMNAFVLLLFEKRRISFISYIDDFYRKFADELKEIVRASLVSATELPSETIKKISASLSKRTGKDVVLNVEQDPELIGGIVTRIGDLVLDGSVKTQLLNMRESLKRGESV